ncbi:transcriptional regulator [Pseudomonas khavaziana]|uniref:transcriptional regulator n=1 Tax=Pseudomonas khavaziana TaxID=2842351 RepID=UPI001C3C78E1|nr:Cro/CI family transcriptional regulator [Pseudomonas khavaziana]MBV4480029.1 helix-turn-helix domain-containing protein [Pseudomonas khavaziana]
MTNVFGELATFYGGQVAMAKALGVTQGTVSGWVRGIHGCSAEIAFLIERMTEGKFLASQLRPSLANASPTLNANVRPNPADHQSPVGAGVLSSGFGSA